MSVLIERPEIASFIHTWQGKPAEQVTEELASYSLETKRIPDPYDFIVTADGELLSPVAHRKVKDIVQRTITLGEIEYRALCAIEQWVQSSSEGVAAWISPPYPGIYPTSKIIISEIKVADGLKRLSNTAIVLDIGESECLKLAQGLTQYSSNRSLMTHLDEVRANPLILNTPGLHWTYILGEFIGVPLVWESIRRGESLSAKKEALIQAQAVQKAFFEGTTPLAEAKIMALEMLGDQPGSCPVIFAGTAFQVFSGSSLAIGENSFLVKDRYGSLEFQCPHPDCGKINRRPYGQLIPTCQHCGKDVRC